MKVIEIRDASGTKVAQLGASECTAIITRSLNDTWSLQVTYPWTADNNKSEYIVEDYQARVLDPDSGAYQTFVISNIVEKRTERGNIIYEFTANHVAIGTMSKEIVTAHMDFKQETPANILTAIMGYSSYSSGTVNPTAKIDLTISWESVLSAVLKLVEATGTYYDVDEANGQIDILTSLGANNCVRVEPDRNLKSLQRATHTSEIINKMYATGSGEPPVTLAGTPHKVKSMAGAVITCQGNKVVTENDIWNGFKIEVLIGPNAGTQYTISDCAAGSTDDSITLSTSPVLPAGTLFKIVTAGGADVDYIPVGSADKEGVFQAGDKQDNTNFIVTPMLDGTYTAGLCQDWAKVSTPTVSENTSSTYTQYGQKSQRVQTTTTGQGVSQQIVHNRPNETWCVVANVYLASGSAVLALTSDPQVGFLIATNTAGWQTLVLKGVVNAGNSITVYVLSGTATSDFYVDSVWCMNTTEPKRFTAWSEKTEMWAAAYDRVQVTKNPRVTYQCNFVDLHKWDPGRYPFDAIALGDTVRVKDELLSIDVDQTVVTVKDNVFQPELSETVISNE